MNEWVRGKSWILFKVELLKNWSAKAFPWIKLASKSPLCPYEEKLFFDCRIILRECHNCFLETDALTHFPSRLSLTSVGARSVSPTLNFVGMVGFVVRLNFREHPSYHTHSRGTASIKSNFGFTINISPFIIITLSTRWHCTMCEIYLNIFYFIVGFRARRWCSPELVTIFLHQELYFNSHTQKLTFLA